MNRDELQAALDAAQAEVATLQQAMAVRREEFQAAVEGAGDFDTLAFKNRVTADTLRLIQLQLAAARADLALVKHDAQLADGKRQTEYAKLRDLEAQINTLKEEHRIQQGTHSKSSGRLSALNERHKTLQAEIEKLQSSLLSAVDGKTSGLQPRPTGFDALVR